MRTGMGRKVGFAALGLLVSGVSLHAALRGISGTQLVQTLSDLRAIPAAGCAALVALGVCLRGIRWRFILQGSATRPAVFIAAAFLGIFSNQILPARAGEFVRIFSLHRLSRAGLGKILGSAVLDRGCDLVVLILCAGLVSTCVQEIDVPPEGWLVFWFGMACVGVILFGISSGRLRAAVTHWSQRLTAPWSLRSAEFLVLFIDMLKLQFSGVQLLRLALCGVLVLCADYGAVAMAVLSTGASVPLAAPLVLWVALASSAMVPAGPAHLGVYQWAAVWILGLYEIEQHRSVAAAFILQGTLLIVSGVCALLFLAVVYFRAPSDTALGDRPPHERYAR
jgi:uncharacterized protein (TIRG00374 family)